MRYKIKEHLSLKMLFYILVLVVEVKKRELGYVVLPG
jgi:hypothetical protein